jgi:hypothetical protein
MPLLKFRLNYLIYKFCADLFNLLTVQPINQVHLFLSYICNKMLSEFIFERHTVYLIVVNLSVLGRILDQFLQ